MMRVHTPQKNCCRLRQLESGRFAPRGFACRAEDKEIVGEHKPLPLDFDMTGLPLYPPVQAKLAGGSAGDGPENEDAASSKGTGEKAPAFRQVQPEAHRQEPNRTGMPDRLKAGIETLSGIDMSDVRVHANSALPAQLNALAYTQGNQIYMGPGQERHLPHEAWHVVQQAQGRVQPNINIRGVGVNDCIDLELEATKMGQKATFSCDDRSFLLRNASNQLSPNRDHMHLKVVQLNKLTEGSADTLVGMAKRNIKKLVHETYGKSETDSPTETDMIAKSLTTFQEMDSGVARHKDSRNCTAFVSTDDDKALIAFNTKRQQPTDDYMGIRNPHNIDPAQGLPWNLQGTQYEIVRSTRENMHAECILADELSKREPGVVFSPIGITQPCCMLCAAVMAVLGYSKSVRGYHTKNVTNWACPDVIKNQEDNLKKFLGEDVYNQIIIASNGDDNDLKDNKDIILRLLSQRNTDWKNVH